MKEKDLPFDRTKHAVYSGKAKKCVNTLLHRYYDEKTAEELWERIQLQYTEFLKDEPALGKVKMKVSIYDPILIFAWYVTVPDKPPLQEIQDDVFECFMGSYDFLGKIFDLNRKFDNRLAGIIFKAFSALREQEIRSFPASFRMGFFSYDKKEGIVRYNFTQCPNAEFAKRHHLEDVLPVMCNCDHMAMQKLNGYLIREGTCVTADCCDYCILGSRHPLAKEYDLVRMDNGLLVSVKKNGI